MLTFIAPDIHHSRRIPWLKEHFSSHKYDLVLVESRESLKWVRLGGYRGEMEIYSEHEQKGKLPPEVEAALKTQSVGFLSDGGAPTVGDPGHELAHAAHCAGVSVKSAGIHSYILAALVMSGCTGNRFEFLGYPPRDPKERRKFLKEQIHRKPRIPLVVMDTPYRTLHLIEDLVSLMDKSAWLSVSTDIGGEKELTVAGDAQYWKTVRLEERFGKKPLAVAVLG